VSHFVASGRYSLEYERDGGRPLPVTWYRDGLAVPELPDEIEDELLELAIEHYRENTPPMPGRMVSCGPFEPPEFIRNPPRDHDYE
jgi:hypothetical protein